jgi:hypothetical protein
MAKTDKKRKRLSNLVIDEVSLVDNPAVPEAKYCIAKRDTSTTESDMSDATLEAEVETADAGTEQAAPAPVDPVSAAAEIASESNQEIPVAKEETAEADEVVSADPVQKASKENVAAAFLTAVNTLKGVAGDMSPYDLSVYARLMEFTSHRFSDNTDVQAAGFMKSSRSIEEIVGHNGPVDMDSLVTQLQKMRVMGSKEFKKIAQASEALAQVQAILGEVQKSAKRVVKADEETAEEVETAETASKNASPEGGVQGAGGSQDATPGSAADGSNAISKQQPASVEKTDEDDGNFGLSPEELAEIEKLGTATEGVLSRMCSIESRVKKASGEE